MDKQTKLIVMICLSSLFFFAELFGGYVYGSVALIADSFHMLSDIFSFIIALYATRISKAVVGPEFSFGLQRAEIIGALINGCSLLSLSFILIIEAMQRLIEPSGIENPWVVLCVASSGLAMNVVGMLIFHGHSHGHSHGHDHSGHAGHSHFEDRLLHDEENPHEPHTHTHNGQVYHQLPTDLEEIVEQDPLELNTAVVKAAELLKKEHTHTDLNLHGVYLHLFGDLLTSIGVISSTLIIIYVKQDWTIYMDPLMSLLITVIIIISTIPLCRSAIFILLQATPQTISLPALKKDLMKIRGIANIHELHVWQLSDTQIIGSVHVVLAKTNESYMEIADLIKIKMHDHGIHSSTVQPEFVDEYDDCALQCPVGCDELRCCPLERTE